MDLSNFLSEESIATGLSVSSKKDVLKEIAKLASKNQILQEVSEDVIYKKLSEREKIGSTGFENGVAIPHCTMENISDFVVGVVVVPEGVDFKSIDKSKSKIFVFIIAPASRRNEHIGILSRVTRILKNQEKFTSIINSTSSAEVMSCFTNKEIKENSTKKESEEHNLVTVIVQKEELFTEVLNIFNQNQESFVSVIEGTNVRNYLYQMPLFSSFWNDDEKGFNRVILSTVKKSKSNGVIREINTILDSQEDQSGLVVFLQDILYFNGKLNF